MGEENKSGDEKSPNKNINKIPCQDSFPPKFIWWKKWIVLPFIWITLSVSLLYLADQLCFKQTPSCICCTYIAFGLVLSIIVIDRWIYHEIIVHNARLEDVSEVEATFVEAKVVELANLGYMSEEEYFKKKKSELDEEVKRLKELGNRGWTEYQILSLNQMLVEFLDIDELKARARSSLDDLEDYADDSSYRYDQKQYDKWKDIIKKAIDKVDNAVDNAENEEQKNTAMMALQAELQMLLEHIASYHANWSRGSAILNGIKVCGCLSLPLLIGMGLLLLFHPMYINGGEQKLSVLNWGIFGIIGAMTAVLLGLRKSDYVEVGNTEGRKELWRTIPGIALGLLAGTLAYWMIAGELFTHGGIVPDLDSSSLKDTGLSILWAVASGFCFEKVFDRMVSTTVGGN